MKSIGELFKELGFKSDADIETQKAFFKNLVKQANTLPRPIALKEIEKPLPKAGEQLSFNLEDDSKQVS